MHLSYILNLLDAAEEMDDANPWQRPADYGTRLAHLQNCRRSLRDQLAEIEIPITVSTRALAQDRDEDPPDLYNSRRDAPPRADGNPF